MFGQVVVGPPGSGKSTYCRGMQQFMRGVGRNAVVINLDPANEEGARDVTEGEEGFETAAVDVNELIRLEDAMEELDLGPNGGMVYCIEFLERNVAWLEGKLRALLAEDPYTYMLFDLPGQVEISAHHPSLRNIMRRLIKRLNLRLTAVHLVDAYHCAEPSKYISAVFLSLSTMLRLELPHVNVLSKIDLVEAEGSLDFNLDFYTQVMDLDYLLPLLPSTPRYQGGDRGEDGSEADGPPPPPPSRFEEKFRRLNQAVCGLIEQYSLVAFHTLNIQDKESVVQLVRHIDKTNEYTSVMSAEESEMLGQSSPLATTDLHERYMPSSFA